MDATGEKTAVYGDKNLLAAWSYEVYDGEYKLRTFGSSDKESSPECYANGFDATNAKEVSVATAKSHASMLERFLHNGKISEKHGMATIPTVPLIRMSERLDGVYSLKMSVERKEFSDSVGCFASWKEIDKVFELPYSCLTGTKIKNVIAAGRCISANDDVWELTRVIPVCAVSGEAAGIAGSMGDDLTAQIAVSGSGQLAGNLGDRAVGRRYEDDISGFKKFAQRSKRCGARPLCGGICTCLRATGVPGDCRAVRCGVQSQSYPDFSGSHEPYAQRRA